MYNWKSIGFYKKIDKTEQILSSPMNSNETYFVNTVDELDQYIINKRNPDNCDWTVKIFSPPELPKYPGWDRRYDDM